MNIWPTDALALGITRPSPAMIVNMLNLIFMFSLNLIDLQHFDVDEPYNIKMEISVS